MVSFLLYLRNCWRYSPRMTTPELAGCIAVIKNLLLAGKINPSRTVRALWDLADSVCDSAHYVPGVSPVIDSLVAECAIAETPERTLEKLWAIEEAHPPLIG